MILSAFTTPDKLPVKVGLATPKARVALAAVTERVALATVIVWVMGVAAE